MKFAKISFEILLLILLLTSSVNAKESTSLFNKSGIDVFNNQYNAVLSISIMKNERIKNITKIGSNRYLATLNVPHAYLLEVLDNNNYINMIIILSDTDFMTENKEVMETMYKTILTVLDVPIYDEFAYNSAEFIFNKVLSSKDNNTPSILYNPNYNQKYGIGKIEDIPAKKSGIVIMSL